MEQVVITDKRELRRIVRHVKSGCRDIDDLYRAILRIAIVDLDDLSHILKREFGPISSPG